MLRVGDLASRVDWGFAPEYVEAMRAILQLSEPDDFVVASGNAHSVEEFVSSVFGYFDLDWREYVEEDPTILFRQQPLKIGNSTKLTERTGISLAHNLDEFVRLLVEDHIYRFSKEG